MMKANTRRRAVLVTGANGYIGNAVAKAFCAAGWKTFGLVRRREDAADLARHEIHAILGSPTDPSFLEQVEREAFDVVVSNTEDRSDPAGHFEGVRGLLGKIGSHGQRAGIRPLAMFTSGCKDYGKMREKHGDAGLRPHTERDPLEPPQALEPRARFGAALLAAGEAPYDATVLRPTIVYGNASSLYGMLFDLAEGSAGVIRMVGDPDAVMHSVHVDDCARAYVALAEHPDRSRIAGQAFNVASGTYETAREVGLALARSYGSAIEFIAADGEVSMASAQGLANFSQWVGSEKLRSLTGWRERKPRFAAGIDDYRLAYEAHRNVVRPGPSGRHPGRSSLPPPRTLDGFPTFWRPSTHRGLTVATREPIYPADRGRHALYDAHRYSPAIRSGDLLFVSGQVGSRPDGSPEPDFAAQVRLAFENLSAVLRAAGCGFDDIVDVTSFSTDPKTQSEVVKEVRTRMFGGPPYPNWTAVGVSWLSGFDFEIKVIARIPGQTSMDG